MKITYDKEAEALYIEIKNIQIERTKRIAPTVFIDLDKKNNIVGIEILDPKFSILC